MSIPSISYSLPSAMFTITSMQLVFIHVPKTFCTQFLIFSSYLWFLIFLMWDGVNCTSRPLLEAYNPRFNWLCQNCVWTLVSLISASFTFWHFQVALGKGSTWNTGKLLPCDDHNTELGDQGDSHNSNSFSLLSSTLSPNSVHFLDNPW